MSSDWGAVENHGQVRMSPVDLPVGSRSPDCMDWMALDYMVADMVAVVGAGNFLPANYTAADHWIDQILHAVLTLANLTPMTAATLDCFVMIVAIYIVMMVLVVEMM